MEGERAHIILTYCSILSLIILGDDLSRVRRECILKSLKYLQDEEGNIASVYGTKDTDARFIYGALNICNLLGGDFGDYLNVEKIAKYVSSC